MTRDEENLNKFVGSKLISFTTFDDLDNMIREIRLIFPGHTLIIKADTHDYEEPYLYTEIMDRKENT
jgi:hypothetical protein